VEPQRLYYFTSDEFGLLGIKDRRLKLSFSNSVNDLFELSPFDFGDSPIGKKIRRAWKRKIVDHSFQQGFISMSEKWDVPTMWAHYADNHRGVCLGFDISGEKATKIEYVPDLIELDDRVLTDDAYNRKMTNIAQKTKSKHWEYEAEWRLWCNLSQEEISRRRKKKSALCYLDFDNGPVLREVRFGYRSGLSSSDLKKHLTGSDDVTFTTVRPSFREFKMVPQQNLRYQK
jgi:hypothetical protein